jgi:hypothetical protein
MRRDTEFRWQPTSCSRSKLGMSLLVGVAGLATGYMFVHSGRQEATHVSSPASPLETAGTHSPPAAQPANDEPSAVATAAAPPLRFLNLLRTSPFAEPTSAESSAVATTARPLAQLPSPPAEASVERELPGAPRVIAKSRSSSSYATLRQVLLRKIR